MRGTIASSHDAQESPSGGYTAKDIERQGQLPGVAGTAEAADPACQTSPTRVTVMDHPNISMNDQNSQSVARRADRKADGRATRPDIDQVARVVGRYFNTSDNELLIGGLPVSTTPISPVTLMVPFLASLGCRKRANAIDLSIIVANANTASRFPVVAERTSPESSLVVLISND